MGLNKDEHMEVILCVEVTVSGKLQKLVGIYFVTTVSALQCCLRFRHMGHSVELPRTLYLFQSTSACHVVSRSSRADMAKLRMERHLH